ncbi:hypothetical protein [Herbiconiux daphne]|uniref:Uncharacterized protein n=1 Tax=Herbiconiux daphne TaxID=2970914 RepID=A0ABT2GWP5_9MICO|nr:hypothetical protein [Herbiconiux daphne]MCS5732380.1 hypothetical protein [Herbiconiux daphne]
MVSIDEGFAVRWVKFMRELLAENLDDVEFTRRRMAGLELWTRDRKREAHNLHYRYDPRRRNPRLIVRDMNALEAKIAAFRATFDAMAADSDGANQTRDAEATTKDAARAPRKLEAAPRTVEPSPPVIREMRYFDPKIEELVLRETGLDVRYNTDQQVLDAYTRDGTFTPPQIQARADFLKMRVR